MFILYFIQGFLYGLFTLVMALIETLIYYGEIAVELDKFIGYDDCDKIEELMEKKSDCK